MDELIAKLYKLIDELDKLSVVNNLKYYNEIIENNTELIEKINTYHKTHDYNLKLDIYSYHEIKKYKECETNINFLIMEINNKLKKILK